MTYCITRLAILGSMVVVSASVFADWPEWGGSPARNNAPEGLNIPTEWQLGDFDAKSGRWNNASAQNIRWVAQLGTTTYGTPVVADGKVLCATNNGAGWLKRYPPEVDLGCLLCFDQSDGGFRWQLSREKLAAGRLVDYPEQGICSTPLVEGKRLWIVTNRCEVACVATDGPSENTLWLFDMIKELGVTPYYMSACSVTSAGDLLLVNTSNGADPKRSRVPNPQSPSFIALDKRTGKLVWADNSPGDRILDGQWSSPAFAVMGGVAQAIFAGGDGWIYSFRPDRINNGKPELLWKCDLNPKTAVWKEDGSGDRNSVVATPVICRDRVYIATGSDPEYGEGPGDLWCIDATRRGDVSRDVVIDREGKAVLPRRGRAIDPTAGETARPNPNSAIVWHYAGFDANGDGKLDFEESMHRTPGMAAIRNNLLVIADIGGLVHCLDAQTGHPHWTHDLKCQVWGSPCLVDGKIYLGNLDGEVVVFDLSAEKNLLATNTAGSAVYTAPVVADNVLHISTSTHLIAIGHP